MSKTSQPTTGEDPKALRKAIDEVAELSKSVTQQLEALQQSVKKINDISDW